jgi:hypothetical protein
MSKGDAVIVVSDTHINSTVGLSPNLVYNDNGDKVESNKTRRWLNRAWLSFLDDAEQMTEGYRRIVVLNGDLAEYDSNNRSWQMISRNPSTIVTMACDVFEPLANMADKMFVLRGTEAHTGKNAYIEEEIAKDLGAEPDPETGTASWWHLRSRWAGVRFDIAHHVTMGTLPHTEKNAANKLAYLTTWAYAVEWKEPLPHIVIRSHTHRYADSGYNYEVRAYLTPAWQSKTAYIHRIGKANDKPQIGGLVFLCNNGKTTNDPRLIYKPPRRTVWTK